MMSSGSPAFFDALTGHRLAEPPAGVWRIAEKSAQSLVVGPAFFDPQVNGFGGVDFQAPDLDAEQLDHAIRAIHRSGCSHFLITLITNSPERLEAQFRKFDEILSGHPDIAKWIPGFHLEGPFLSPEVGYRGAHPPEHMALPDIDLFDRLQSASGGRIRLLTVAPELEGCLELIRAVSSRCVCVSAGHTNADLPTLVRACQAGLSMFTHLGNGCATEVPRHDNIIQRVLALPDLLVSLIPDGIHLPPFVVSNLIKGLGSGRTIFTTDAMSAAAAPPGQYLFGPLQVTVSEDRAVRLPGTNILAGSSLRMVEGFHNVVRFGGMSVDQAWRSWTRLQNLFIPEAEIPLIAIPFPG